MKKIFFAFSILALILSSCSESNETTAKQDNNLKDNIEKTIDKEEVNFEKAATKIVYALAVYLYEDGLVIKEDELNKDKKEDLKGKYNKIVTNSELDTLDKIDALAKILNEEPLELEGSKTRIEENKVKIKDCKSVEDISSLIEGIEGKLENEERTDLDINPPKHNKYVDFIDRIKKIKSGIEEKTKKTPEPIIELKLTQENIKELKTKLNDDTFTKPAIPTWLYAIPAILFALLAAAIYFIKKIYDSLERLKMKRESDKQKFNDLKYNHDRLNNKVAVIDIDAVRNEMYEQMNILAGRINDTQSEQVRNIRSAPQAKPEPKIFYAQYPDSSDPIGFKNIQFESNSKMVYRISRIEGNKASFIIQNDENTQQYAIGNHGKILKPVCEYLNQPSSLNRTIKVFREGRLEMQNNIWIVVEKLKIKFE